MSRDVDRWERGTEWPLAILAVAFLVTYAFGVLDERIPSGDRDVLHLVDIVIWVAFAVDFVARLWLARQWRYFWTHLHDLAMIALPALRPLRLLRLLMLLRVLNRRGASSLHGRVVVYVAGSASILVFCASLAILDAERGHRNANINSFGDALWWAITTVSTVGYGDRYPVTTEGRFVAAGLMIGGVALIGVVTATFASWLIDRVRDLTETEQAATRRDLDQLHTALRTLQPSGLAVDLGRIASMHQSGQLTDQEFSAAKSKLLDL